MFLYQWQLVDKATHGGLESINSAAGGQNSVPITPGGYMYIFSIISSEVSYIVLGGRVLGVCVYCNIR